MYITNNAKDLLQVVADQLNIFFKGSDDDSTEFDNICQSKFLISYNGIQLQADWHADNYRAVEGFLEELSGYEEDDEPFNDTRTEVTVVPRSWLIELMTLKAINIDSNYGTEWFESSVESLAEVYRKVTGKEELFVFEQTDQNIIDPLHSCSMRSSVDPYVYYGKDFEDWVQTCIGYE